MGNPRFVLNIAVCIPYGNQIAVCIRHILAVCIFLILRHRFFFTQASFFHLFQNALPLLHIAQIGGSLLIRHILARTVIADQFLQCSQLLAQLGGIIHIAVFYVFRSDDRVVRGPFFNFHVIDIHIGAVIHRNLGVRRYRRICLAAVGFYLRNQCPFNVNPHVVLDARL